MDTASSLTSMRDARVRPSLRLLGGFELRAGSVEDSVVSLGKRERILLAYLVLSPNFRRSRQKLAALLWDDVPEENALRNLRNCLWNLRKALDDSEHRLVASDGEDIALNVPSFDVDVLVFRSLAAQSGRTELEAAKDLYNGELLDGIELEGEEFDSWRRAEATRYRDQAVNVLDRLMTQLAASHETERAIEAGTRLLGLDPLNEAVARRLMRLYAESGRRGQAIQLYRTVAEVLKTELATGPEAETRATFAELICGGDQSAAPILPLSATKAQAAVSADEVKVPAEPEMPVPVPNPGPAERASARYMRRLGWIGTGVVAAAIAAFAFFHFTPSSSSARSIPVAVLPFTNLSDNAAQTFFSDGMAEEVTSALAKVPGLQMVARASAFQFKGQKSDMRAVGQALGARYVIDGTVRTEGKRVRITAQLVQTDSGLSLWSDSYDRELTDVFAIQEDIARAISASLRAPLGLKSDGNLVSNRDIDADTYGELLRAKALVRIRAGDRAERARALADATALLEPIVARYPNFAPAWGQLALIYQRMPIELRNANTPVEAWRLASEQWLAKAEAASERAIALDPSAPDGYSSLGLTMAMRGHLVRAGELLSKALAIDPFYPEALHSYSNLLDGAGHHKEALATREKVASIEPFVPVYRVNLNELRWINGQTDAAIDQLLKRKPPQVSLARIYALTGHDTEAVDVLKKIPHENFPDGMLENAVRLMRTAATDEIPTKTVPALNADLNFVYLHIGALERIIQPLEDSVAAGYLPPHDMSFVWQPAYAPLRRTERFKAFARSYGLVDYWRAKGWPPECRPRDANDFACN